MKIMFLNYFPQNPGDEERSARREAALNRYASPGTRVELHFPDELPGGSVIADHVERQVVPALDHQLRAPGVIRRIVWAEQRGYDAVVQSNTFDPAVDAARQAVRIPVVGVCRASLHVAASLTDSIGVTVPLETHVSYAWQVVRRYQLQHLVKDIRAIGVYENAADRLDEIVARNVEVMKGLVNDTRAGCLIPLGGALVPQLVDPKEIEEEVGVPVLNTNAIGIRFAEMYVQLGLSHTSRTQPSVTLRSEAFDTLINGHSSLGV
jgi:allantoin racemase